jgi:hypothetical protein
MANPYFGGLRGIEMLMVQHFFPRDPIMSIFPKPLSTNDFNHEHFRAAFMINLSAGFSLSPGLCLLVPGTDFPSLGRIHTALLGNPSLLQNLTQSTAAQSASV